MTSSWVRHKASSSTASDAPPPAVELCDFYENLEGQGLPQLPSGVYDLEDLRALGRDSGVCPYFLARRVCPSFPLSHFPPLM